MMVPANMAVRNMVWYAVISLVTVEMRESVFLIRERIYCAKMYFNKMVLNPKTTFSLLNFSAGYTVWTLLHRHWIGLGWGPDRFFLRIYHIFCAYTTATTTALRPLLICYSTVLYSTLIIMEKKTNVSLTHSWIETWAHFKVCNGPFLLITCYLYHSDFEFINNYYSGDNKLHS